MITRETLLEQIKQAALDKAQYADSVAAWHKAHGTELYAIHLLGLLDQEDAKKRFEDAKKHAEEVIAKNGGPLRPEDVEPKSEVTNAQG